MGQILPYHLSAPNQPIFALLWFRAHQTCVFARGLDDFPVEGIGETLQGQRRKKKGLFFFLLLCCFPWQPAGCCVEAVLHYWSTPYSLLLAPVLGLRHHNHGLHGSTPVSKLGCFALFLPQGSFFLWPLKLSSVFNLNLVGRHSSKFHNFFLHSPLSLRVVYAFCSCCSVLLRVLFYPLL